MTRRWAEIQEKGPRVWTGEETAGHQLLDLMRSSGWTFPSVRQEGKGKDQRGRKDGFIGEAGTEERAALHSEDLTNAAAARSTGTRDR